MVGIVVVSHSRALATAAVALAREMVPDPTVRIEVAAGLDETTFGTDAVAIAGAITAADTGDGVLVLMDVGSAVLSAELALELLDDDVRSRVMLSPAPLVEGLLAAAVTAVGEADLAEVTYEALAGLTGKAAALAAPDAEPEPPTVDEVLPTATARFTLTTTHGLHARPAARLARLAARLDADVGIRNLTTSTDWVPARSLSRLTALGAVRGHELELSASGPAGPAAIEAVLALARDNFGDPPEPADRSSLADRRAQPASFADAAKGKLSGIPAGPGIGIGPARIQRPGPVELPERSVGSPAEEQHRLDRALATAAEDLRTMQADTADHLGVTESVIFDAQLTLLADPEMLSDAAEQIAAGRSAEAAWTGVTERVAESIEALDDEYLRARASDVRELQDHILRALAGESSPVGSAAPGAAVREAEPPGVLLAVDLTAAQAAYLDPATTLAVVLAFSTSVSHAAILVRARGIPLVVAVGPRLLAIPAGAEVAVNGDTGDVLVNPKAKARRALLEQAARQEAAKAAALREAAGPARTTDGVQILVGANLGSLEDARSAAESGADLAGLVRTEFLFLDRDQAPEVEEQVEVYSGLAEAMNGRRLTLRTLDVGGDKPLPYAPTPASANPFLGVRGLRLSLAQPELFRDQLRAIIRVAHQTPVSVMFPMVSTLTEVHAARRLLEEVIASEGRGTPTGLEVGIMVEVPAVALKTVRFAAAVDFFSIGTNDLTQYALAAERGNPDVAALSDPYDAGVLALIRAVCQGAAGRSQVAVCGDLAGDPGATALLIGLGVGTLSVSPPAVPLVKQAVRAVDATRAAGLAATALAMRQTALPSA